MNIVFTTVTEQLDTDLRPDRASPGQNVTGTWGNTSELDDDRLALLYSYVFPHRSASTKVGILVNPGRPGLPDQLHRIEDKAEDLDLVPNEQNAHNDIRINQAFDLFRTAEYLGAVVMADSLFNNKRDVIIGAEIKAPRVPTIYQWKDFVEKGGLMSYGPDIAQAYKTAGEAVAQCCAGVNYDGNAISGAWEIPIAEATEFEFWVNDAARAALMYTKHTQVPNPDGGGGMIDVHYY